MEDRSGQTLDGRYSLVRRVGSGGLGQVYEGVHVVTGRKVAIKLLHAELATNAEAAGRFYREARAAASIGSKHICDVLDMRPPSEGPPFLVMEYLEGETLATRLARRGRLDLQEALPIVLQVLEGLEAAHAAGIVHRDVKPENVFIVEVEGKSPLIKVVDFGTSKFRERGEDLPTLTRPGAVLGTPHYISPEQARGEGAIGPLSDVYAVGVILYESLTGSLPYDAERFTDLLMQIVTGTPAPPSTLRSDIPAELDALILKAFAREPTDRFASAQEMAEALLGLANRIFSSPPVEFRASASVSPMPPIGGSGSLRLNVSTPAPGAEERLLVTTPPPRGRSRTPVIVGVALAVVLILGAGLATYWFVPGLRQRTVIIDPVRIESLTPPAKVGDASGPQDAGSPREPDAPPRSVRVVLSALPAEAALRLDDALLDVNPAEVELPIDDRTHTLSAEAKGYGEVVREFHVKDGTEVSLELVKLAPTKGRTGKRHGSGGHPKKGKQAGGTVSNVLDPWDS